MRILHIINHLEGGGAERQLRLLVNHIDATQFVNAICCTNLAGHEKVVDSVPIFHLPRRSRFDLRWFAINQLMERWQPNIVHIWLPAVIWSGAVPAVWQRRICVGSYRSAYHFRKLNRVLQAVGFLFMRQIVSNVHVDEQNQPYRGFFHAKQGQFIPNGLDLDHIRSGKSIDLSTWKLASSRPCLLYVGRLMAEKNVATILSALAQLKRKGILINLLICGTGPDEAMLQVQVATKNLDEQVRFLGYRSDVYNVMHSCQFFVLPSFREGMPNTLLEAMTVGLPIVASDIGVHRRWLKNGRAGLLFDPANPAELATCLRRLLTESPAETQTRQDEATVIVNELTITNMVMAYEKFYTNLIETRQL